MKVQLPTLDVDGRVRRAIAHHMGYKAPASRVQIRRLVDALITGWIEELCYEMDEATE